MTLTFNDSQIDLYRKFLSEIFPGMNVELSTYGAKSLFEIGTGETEPIYMLARIEGTITDLDNEFIAGSLFETSSFDADILNEHLDNVKLRRQSTKLIQSMGVYINDRYNVSDLTPSSALQPTQVERMFATPRKIVCYNVFLVGGGLMMMRYQRNAYE